MSAMLSRERVRSKSSIIWKKDDSAISYQLPALGSNKERGRAQSPESQRIGRGKKQGRGCVLRRFCRTNVASNVIEKRRQIDLVCGGRSDSFATTNVPITSACDRLSQALVTALIPAENESR